MRLRRAPRRILPLWILEPWRAPQPRQVLPTPPRPMPQPVRKPRLPQVRGPTGPRSPGLQGPTRELQSVFSWLSRSCALQSVFAGLAGADAHDLLERRHEHLAVSDLAGARSALDGLDDAVDDRIVDGGFDLHLGEEVDHVLRAAVKLGVALLAAEALDFGHRDA